jgi:AcrR family transcriptional regulator
MVVQAPPLLDVAVAVLVADPSASLAEVAKAAGIGRTTLHKHYKTRDDLVRAVGHRAIDRWEAAIDSVIDQPDVSDELRALVEATIPIGPQLAFLWRTPVFDKTPEIAVRWSTVEKRGLAVLTRARAAGRLAAGVPDWWLLQTFYSLIYVASEAVDTGHVAARAAPDLMLRTYLHGIGAPADPE